MVKNDGTKSNEEASWNAAVYVYGDRIMDENNPENVYGIMADFFKRDGIFIRKSYRFSQK